MTWVPLKTEYRFFQVKQRITHFDSLYHPEATKKYPKKTTSNELKGPTVDFLCHSKAS